MESKVHNCCLNDDHEDGVFNNFSIHLVRNRKMTHLQHVQILSYNKQIIIYKPRFSYGYFQLPGNTGELDNYVQLDLLQ